MIPVLSHLASFTQPMSIGNSPWSLLWIIPLTASIAIVYKATKVFQIDTKKFLRETSSLFGSILVFIAVAGIILCLIAWLINDYWPTASV